MIDPYSVLNLDRGASQNDIQAAFQELLAARKARRQNANDLHVAVAILSDAGLRRTWDLECLGVATTEKLVKTKDAAIEVAGQVAEMVPEIDLKEAVRSAWQATLRVIVLTTGTTAKAAELTAMVSRTIQLEAGKRITESTSVDAGSDES